MDAEEQAFEGIENLREVEGVDGIIVVRSDVVALLDEQFDVVLDVWDGCVVVGHEGDEINLVAQCKDLLHGGERQDDRLINGTIDIDIFGVGPCHAHHLEIDAVHLDHLPKRIFAFLKHRFIHFLAQNAHFSVGSDVSFINETPFRDFRAHNLVVFGHHSFHRETAAATAIDHVFVLA